MNHMPFLMYDNKNRRIMFFAQAEEGVTPHWKLFYQIGGGEPQRLETGFSEAQIECSPTAWQDEAGWHVSFVAQDERGGYRLYRMDGETLQNLSQPVSIRITRTGFVYKDRLAVGEMQDVVHVHDSDGDHLIELSGVMIYRVAYRADEPDKILISGGWVGEKEEPFTIEYDLNTDEQRYIEIEGKPTYKATIYGNEILYAEQTGKNFESRTIRHHSRFDAVRCQLAVRHQNDNTLLNVSKKCGCRRNKKEESNEAAARPSCLECVEKHLGAAFVIVSEIHDGYSYRLRLIGHLHEAEDESQEFVKLHEMIRHGRKEYQRIGKIPDWELFAQQIAEVKNAG